MKNKKKESWLLKDPNFVPKNKKIRITMFIIINLILICLLPILAIYINYPYGYLCWVLVFSFSILFNIKAFHVHAERYPLNNYSEYIFNPLSDLLTEMDKNFIIEIERKFNIYEVRLKEKTLIFDMKGCIFPLTIINAYLGRQFIIKIINKLNGFQIPKVQLLYLLYNNDSVFYLFVLVCFLQKYLQLYNVHYMYLYHHLDITVFLYNFL